MKVLNCEVRRESFPNYKTISRLSFTKHRHSETLYAMMSTDSVSKTNFIARNRAPMYDSCSFSTNNLLDETYIFLQLEVGR